jgi:predicted GIY-YIG superfamily endonuclease
VHQPTYVYVLRCADGAYYVGTTRGDLEDRVAAHDNGLVPGYTTRRRPVVLAFAEDFADPTEAIARERQLKGWSRRKKEAVIAGAFDRLPSLVRKGVRKEG